MLIAAQLFERIFSGKNVLNLYFGEPADQTLAIELMHELRSKTTRDIRRTLRRDKTSESYPVLIVDCQLEFSRNYGCRDFCDFMQQNRAPRFNHYVWQTDRVAGQELLTRLVQKIDRRNAYIKNTGDHRSSTECYYPVRKGQQLAIVHLAV